MNIKSLIRFSVFVLALACLSQSIATGSEEKKLSAKEKKLRAAEDQKKQDEILRREVMGFVKSSHNRQAGEGWLFLAHHYRELRQSDRSLMYLRTLLRSDNIDPRIVWEALLLNSEILLEKKDVVGALKDLERLIKMMPARDYLVRAKVARAKILGRNLTNVKELLAAFKRYFKPFPEKPDIEAIEYLMGFGRGYDLEIAMRALTAWEEIAKFPETAAADQANIHIAMLYAFDLNNPSRALPFIEKVSSDRFSPADALLIRAVLKHFYLKEHDASAALEMYGSYRNRCDDLEGYRVSGILQAQLLSDKMQDYDSAINVLSSLFEIPPHLIASDSISVERQREASDQQIDWAMLASRMAGYISEFRLDNLDRAQYFYRKTSDLNKQRSESVEDLWTVAALKRTEPGLTQAQVLFEMAYEKYRSHKIRESLKLFEEFIEKYPDSPQFREAIFRTAVITDDDLRDYDKALELYQKYLIDAVPQRSTWNLDVLYDWGRIDEVRYRIGNLQALRLKSPVVALKTFEQLASTYPDSYWAMQGLKDSINIYRIDLGDPEKAHELMLEFIAKYPESKDAGIYRLALYKTYLSKSEQLKALYILRDYLDHVLPSEKDFFSLKQQWRDLAFKIREEKLRNILKVAGAKDQISIYENLMDVVCLASSSVPIENLVTEIKGLEINDELRWSLVYGAATRMYQFYPEKAASVFAELAENATGTPKMACLVTLGNIAYRVEKNIDNAVKWYEQAEPLLPLTDPRIETVSYRLGRLYLAQGHGLKGLEKLRLFTARFPRSRHLATAYMVMGDACAALHSPEVAKRYYRRVLRIAPLMTEQINKKIADLAALPTSAQWLKERAAALKAAVPGLVDDEPDTDRAIANAVGKISNSSDIKQEDLPKLDIQALYGLFLAENASAKPLADRMAMFLLELLKRDKVPSDIRARASRQFISTRFFRFRNAERFVEEAQSLLSRHNYADWQEDLLYRMAQAADHMINDHVAATRAYFEYLSFYPMGKRVEDVRRRIPAVYAKAGDKKNAVRFYEKLIEDSLLPDETRVDASIQLAILLVLDEKKAEAIKTLEAALAYKSSRRPDICLRLERLTEDFSYVKRALESEGDEETRFKALQRLIGKSEEDDDYSAAALILRDFSAGFELPEAKVWIEKKSEELGKRGAIEEIENLIDQYPEEPETAGRMFKLARMIEGNENSRYRSEDLFYEITLVYPNSQYYRESKIRAENTRSIKAVAELGDLLKKGVKGREGEEIVLERARLLKNDLKDINAASENLESFIELFPNSLRLDEVYLSLGEIELVKSGDSEKALQLWEKGLMASRDPQNREELTAKINGLKVFRNRVLYTENVEENEKGLKQVFRVWKLEKDHVYALGLLESAINTLENRPDVARMRYYAGRIYEERGNTDKAAEEYVKALRSLYHRGLRKDMVLYRLARMFAAARNEKQAVHYYQALISRYPASLLSRSAYYWLYKYEEKQNNLSRAHHMLETLILFKSLNPVHRDAIVTKIREIESRLNIAELQRLRKYSKTGGSEFPYFIGKVLENSLKDYDKAITQYEEFLKTNPPVRRSREILLKVADLYEKKGDFVKAIGHLDALLDTYEPSVKNFDLIIRIGSLVEDKLKNPDLTQLFFSSIAAEYRKVRKVREFAEAKLRRIEEQKREKTRAPRSRKIVKRVYSEDDEVVLEDLQAIVERQVEDLQDFKQAERQLEDLWNDNQGSLATLDIMKTLVELNMKQLMDPQKAGMYYQRWLEENPNDPLYKEYTMILYEHYMEVLRDGQKALRLLENYIREHPISLETIDIELKLAKANELLIRNFDEARRIYLRIIDTRQNDPIVHEAYFRLGFVLREGFANYDEAVKTWQELIDSFYNNEFADKAQYAIAFTFETYRRDFTNARTNYQKILNLYPNSPLQSQARDALLRIEGK